MKKFFALVLMVSTLIGFSSCFSCEGEHGDEADDGLAARFTDEVLNSFDPDAPYKMYGNSRPIDIQPRPYLHITAGRGAFKNDVQIRVTDIPEEKTAGFNEEMEDLGLGELLFLYDIDAGLAADEVIPGKYEVQFDLNKMGVSEALQPYMAVVRQSGDGSWELMNTKLTESGVLTYTTSQNSLIGLVCVVAVGGAQVAWGGAKLFTIGYTVINAGVRYWLPITRFYKMKKESKQISQSWWTGEAKDPWKGNDLVQLHVPDDFGSFTLSFRYSETENADRTQQYVEKTARRSERVKEITDEVKKKHWRLTAKQRMAYSEALLEKLQDDDELKKLRKDPDLAIPQSILDIIKGTQMGNRFCRTKLELKPLSKEFDVYVTGQWATGTSEAYRMTADMGMGSYVVVNYDVIVTKDSVTQKRTYDKDKFDSVVLTATHEMFHIYQSEYTSSAFLKDQSFFEATASVVEHRFAKWMYDNNYISYDPESEKGIQTLGYSSRQEKQLLGWSLTMKYPGGEDPQTKGGYMLGDLVQFLLDKCGEVSFPDMMNRYAFNKSFAQSLMDIFQITSESAFCKLYEEFCEKHMGEIFTKQSNASTNSTYRYMTLPEQKFDMDKCIVRIKHFGHEDVKGSIYYTAEELQERQSPTSQRAYPYAVKTVELKEWSVKDISKEEAVKLGVARRLQQHYALFAVPSPKLGMGLMRFSFLDSVAKYTPDNLYFNPCTEGYVGTSSAALLFRPNIRNYVINDEDYWIDIVALYQPALNLHVEGMSQDRKGLLIDTRDEPTIALEEHGYVSGMQLCVVNNKTKEKKNFNVPLRLCGEKVKLPYKSMGITDKNKVDVTIRSRWFYRTDDGKTTYYGAAGKPIHYTQNGTQKSQLEEDYPNVEPANAPEENVGEDGEEEGVLMEVTLKYPNVKHYEGRAKMVVTKDKFRIEIMSYNYTYFEKAPVAGMGDFPADLGENITKSGSSTVIEGKCQWFAYSADLSHVITRGHGGSGGTDDDAPTLTDTYPVITEVTSVLPWNEKQKTYQSGGNHAGDKVADSQYNYKFQRDRQRELEAAGPVFFLSEGGFVKGEKMQVEVAAEETYTSMHRTEPRVTDSKKKFSFQILHIDRKN